MWKKIGFSFLLLIISFCLVVFGCNLIIEMAGAGKTYENIGLIPKNKVGIILGTSPKLVGGKSNPYYTNRIVATLDLFKAGKIDYILVSGDSGTPYYNEPNVIKKDLVNGGIPEECILLDHAGFRTLDSMVRAKLVFGLDEVTIISQKFHNKRAIYLAEQKGLRAIGYNAQDLTLKRGFKVQMREYFARVKVFIDLAINTQPKVIGDKVSVQ